MITIQTVKLMLNSAVSTPHMALATIDINDFYIMHDADKINPAFIKCRNGKLPERTRVWLGTAHLPTSAILVFKTEKVMHGQAEAGKVSQDACNDHLRTHGYIETQTSCLFKSIDLTNSIRFCEWVDDFLILYDTRTNQLQDFARILKLKYPFKMNPTATSYLGYQINMYRHPSDSMQDYLDISMPNYAQNGLAKLKFTPTRHPKSPSSYVQVIYSKHPQLEEEDKSPAASPSDKLYLQTAIGIFRYFAEAVAPLLIVPFSKISSQQASPTKNTMQQLERILNWISDHPNSAIRYHPSNMQLCIHSDASYLSEANSRSRAAGFFTCGRPYFTSADNPFKINGAVHILSKTIKNVVRGAYEAEYASMFLNASDAISLRTALNDLNHFQGPTEIIYDNEVAGDIANRTVKQKNLKSLQ